MRLPSGGISRFNDLRGRHITETWCTIILVGTVSITLTGVVFVTMLAPILGSEAWNIQNTLTHAIVPVAAVADFPVTVPGTHIPRKRAFYVIIPPIESHVNDTVTPAPRCISFTDIIALKMTR